MYQDVGCFLIKSDSYCLVPLRQLAVIKYAWLHAQSRHLFAQPCNVGLKDNPRGKKKKNIGCRITKSERKEVALNQWVTSFFIATADGSFNLALILRRSVVVCVCVFTDCL